MTTYTSLNLDDLDANWRSSGRWRVGAAPGEAGGMTLPVAEVFVHHTVTADTGDARRDVADVCDIDQGRFGKVSYSWNVHGSTRTIVECEGVHRGAHTINNANQSLNGISFGFGVVGNFHSTQAVPKPTTPSDDLLDLIAHAIVDKAIVAGYAVRDVRVLGHRDVYATACCGDMLYARLPDLRARVLDLLNPTPTPTPAQESDDMAALLYNDDLDTFAVDGTGKLSTRYNQAGAWHTINLGAGCVPNAHVDVVRGFTVSGHADKDGLDVFAPAANGGLAHAWFTLLDPAPRAWHFEVLA